MAITADTVEGTTSAAVAPVYTSSNNTAITWATFTNFGAGAATLTLHLVPNGGSPTNENMILDAESIVAGDSFSLYAASEKLLMENGDTIQAWSDTASSINAVFSYASI
jgi:hypothetical protein